MNKERSKFISPLSIISVETFTFNESWTKKNKHVIIITTSELFEGRNVEYRIETEHYDSTMVDALNNAMKNPLTCGCCFKLSGPSYDYKLSVIH